MSIEIFSYPNLRKKNVPDVGMIFQAAKLLPKLLLQVYCFVKFDTIIERSSDRAFKMEELP